MRRDGEVGRRALLAAAPAAALYAAIGPRRSARAGDLRKLKVSMAAQSSIYAPYLIPIEKGYYAQEGLALEVLIASGGVATPALMAGTLDITTSNPAVLSPIMRGAPLKILYTMANRSQYQLWSTEPGLKTLKDLKGKQVGIATRGDSFEISVKLALLKSGLPLDWVGFTALGQVSNLEAALIAGSLPAVAVTDTDAEVARRRGALKHGHLIYDMHKNLAMPYSGIAVTDKFLAHDRDSVRGFLRATMKGVRYMRKFKAETMAIVAKYDHQPDPWIREFDYDQAVSTLTKDGSVPDDVLRADLQVRASILNLPKDKIPPLDHIYDYRIVRAVNRELDASHWEPQA